MKVDTRLTKTSAPVETDLTLDWTGVTPAQLQEWAGRTVVISWQRVAREAGKIPAKDHVKVADFMDGKGRPAKIVTPEKILASVDTMTPEAAADLLKQLQAKVKAPKAPAPTGNKK